MARFDSSPECSGVTVRQKTRGTLLVAAVLTVLTATAGAPSFAQDAVPTKDDVARAHGRQVFSPYAGRSYPTRVFFGDTHNAS